ncbi:MAG: hypothetical protein NTW21_31655 [Verrucomicrobia bacterium]|nr:hypothetical protein [Verrucomicrobiota bacterium]
MAHQPAISFSNPLNFPFNRAGGRTSTLGEILIVSTIPFLLIAWVIHVVLAAVVVWPVVFVTRNRVHWHSWELLAVVIPFCVWVGLMFSDMSTGSKTLLNLVVEPGILALALALGALARVALSTSLPEKTASTMTIVGLCFVAAGVFWIVPMLPE